MPLAKIHVVAGRYDQARISKVSGAIQAALMNTLRVPPEDFYQLIFELPKNRLDQGSEWEGHLRDFAVTSTRVAAKKAPVWRLSV